ncbi:CHAT domain-containing protein [Thiorhodococcus drewsii]|uniref:CHAT domain-containing protein n=1 Tax=Thiorhodococcus drewsii TaxID=210408 RepID=UPI0003051D1C|nr:tetratricopeptide repeat protein [Thiorhodococcus drewsii]
MLDSGMDALNHDRYPEARDCFEEGLGLARQRGDEWSIAAFLSDLGLVEQSLGQYSQALEHHEQALGIRRRIHDEWGQAADLSNLGNLYQALDRYPEALSHLQQALAINRRLDALGEAGKVLTNLGIVLEKLDRYQDALDHYDQALPLLREAGDLDSEANTLTNIGVVYLRLGRYPQALTLHRQALAIHRRLGSRAAEANDLDNIGIVETRIDDIPGAMSHFQQALTIRHEIGDRRGEALSFHHLGILNQIQGRYDVALEQLGRARTIFHSIGKPSGESATLAMMGLVFQLSCRYQDALKHYRAALAIHRKLRSLRGEGQTLTNIGAVKFDLGLIQEARDHLQQALAIQRRIDDRDTAAASLNNLGNIDQHQGRHQDALSRFKEALAIHREMGDRAGEGTSLANIGNLYRAMDRNRQAQGYLEQALAIDREVGDRAAEASDRLNLGLVHWIEGDSEEALAHFNQGLTLTATLDTPELSWRLWQAVSNVYAARNQNRAAIAAGKLAVNLLQEMRATNRKLDQRMQEGLLTSRRFVYRDTAERLIQQGRYAEAQQILEMLREVELYDYLLVKDPASDPRRTRASLNPVETDWSQAVDQTTADLRAVEAKLIPLKRILEQVRSDTEQVAINVLTKQHQALESDLRSALDALPARLALITPTEQARINAQMAEIHGGQAHRLASLTSRSGRPTALLQTLILRDHLRLLLTTPSGWSTAVSTLDASTLDKLISALVQALRDPGTDPKPPAKAVYERILGPLEATLSEQGIQTLMSQLDGRLRYLPLAALHDGQGWLAERLAVVRDTTISTPPPPATDRRERRIAGLGTSRPHGAFAALPAVEEELESIVRRQDDPNDQGLLPGTVHLNEAFTEKALRQAAAGDYAIVHIASHFNLQPGNELESALLLGTGELLSMSELRRSALDLTHVDLFTLSACETALGGPDADGIEIEGLADIIQRQGAHGVIASLWSVADTSTAWLMQRFYALRQEQGLDKAEALRRAQMELIDTSGKLVHAAVRKRVPLGLRPSEDGLTSRQADYRHPYYWAPFILMGDWL